MTIKEDIENTYQEFDELFFKETGKPIKHFQMSQIRDQFKDWIESKSPIFEDMIQAEDSFLYIYHFIELQEIRRHSVYLKEMGNENIYQRFVQEFFDGGSPSGLQELKVHQINNESDKIWFSRGDSENVIIEWRKYRFRDYP